MGGISFKVMSSVNDVMLLCLTWKDCVYEYVAQYYPFSVCINNAIIYMVL